MAGRGTKPSIGFLHHEFMNLSLDASRGMFCAILSCPANQTRKYFLWTVHFNSYHRGRTLPDLSHKRGLVSSLLKSLPFNGFFFHFSVLKLCDNLPRNSSYVICLYIEQLGNFCAATGERSFLRCTKRQRVCGSLMRQGEQEKNIRGMKEYST